MKEYLVEIEVKGKLYSIENKAADEVEAMNKAKCELSKANYIELDDMFVTLVEEI